ncbi:MAG: N-acetylmuramoyl-L-alanine amidase [Chthonomonadales bacterium]|nr:N-acetylmuramoyl-L-alanine amidase [Chthonomonadales bacterium]
MAWDIVGRRFSDDDFATYVDGLSLSRWKPDFIVLHNTAVPSLAQRPNGFTPQHIQNLHGFYLGKGWSGCPHLFVDQNGIWVLNPLTRKGVHSPSWNAVAWGIEMLGEYGSEPFDTGPGAMVRANAVSALATLCKKGGFAADTIRFHKEDPKTTHTTCPGKNVRKDQVIEAVRKAMQPPAASDAKLVIYRQGMGDQPAAVIPAELRGGAAHASSAAMSSATGIPSDEDRMVSVRSFLGSRYSLKWVAESRKVFAVEK